VWKYKHIKGHQDNTRKFVMLDPVAQGNELVDHLASQKLCQQHRQVTTSATTWTTNIVGQLVGGNLDKRMYGIIYRPRMIQKWLTLFKIEGTYEHLCHWDLFFRSLANHPANICINLIKYMARILPVGTNLKRQRHADTNECYHINEEETHEHLVRCTQFRPSTKL
jgi:hypothetical protein